MSGEGDCRCAPHHQTGRGTESQCSAHERQTHGTLYISGLPKPFVSPSCVCFGSKKAGLLPSSQRLLFAVLAWPAHASFHNLEAPGGKRWKALARPLLFQCCLCQCWGNETLFCPSLPPPPLPPSPPPPLPPPPSSPPRIPIKQTNTQKRQAHNMSTMAKMAAWIPLAFRHLTETEMRQWVEANPGLINATDGANDTPLSSLVRPWQPEPQSSATGPVASRKGC